MSGLIAAYQTNNAPIYKDLLDRMLSLIAHRGPEGEAIWTDGRVGLAANLLRTTPESLAEHAITYNPKTNCRLIWDGRIDNREELLADLVLSPDITDPDLLIEAYTRWGMDCLKQIIGEFAFVLWDEKNQTLFAGRDRIGVKPFYYHWNGQSFFMSSEAKPLFEALGRVPNPDEEMVLSLLSYSHYSQEDFHRTFFEGILRLPPGSFLQINGDKLKVSRYWAIDPKRMVHYSNEEDYAEEFRSIFTKAVKARLRCSTEPGLFLSGGLDSSAIACVAKAVLPDNIQNLQAVNYYSSTAASDERSYAKEVARHTGVRLHELFTKSRDHLAKLPLSLEEAEMPILGIGTDGEPIEFLRDRGVRAVLSGDGGDHILDEDGFPADLFTRFRLRDFFRATFRYASYFSTSPWIFIKESLSFLLPQPVKNVMRALRKNVPPVFLNISTPAYQTLRHKIFNPPPRPAFHSYAQEVSYRSIVDPYFVFKLEIDDRIYARHGMEIRYPFLDSRLVEFILALPWQLRANGVRKWILRSSLKDLMPAMVLNRRDKGDATDLMDESLRKLCLKETPEPLANRSGLMQRYISFEQTRIFVNRYCRSQSNLRTLIWFIIQTDQWLKQFHTGDQSEKQKKLRKEKIQLASINEVR